MCEVFVVGDEDGWNSGTNFATWSQSHNFTKGDFLGIHHQFPSQLFSLDSNCSSFLIRLVLKTSSFKLFDLVVDSTFLFYLS